MWRARRWRIRLSGVISHRLMELFIQRRHPVPVYRALARKAWR
jgi:hypothetical protein